MTPLEFKDLFLSGEPMSRPIEGLCARIARGRPDEPVRRLADFAGRRLAWVFGPAWLEYMLSRPALGDVVRYMGKDPSEWLPRIRRQGHVLRLVVAHAPDREPATWDGMFRAIDQYYPEVAPRLHRWEGTILTRSLPELTGDRHREFEAAKESQDSPAHISADRLLEIEDTAQHARVFLWHSLGLNAEFRGDGIAPGGEFAREYLTMNRDLGPDDVVIPLDPG
jgi:hypothetical protein